MESQPDIDRPLNPRGYTDAHRMGALLFQKTGKPGVIISSPAIRAISTALIFSDEMKYSKAEIKINPSLYETGEKEYLKVASEIDDSFNTALIFGHNPTISNIYSHFARKLEELPTCAILILQSSAGTWRELSKENTKVAEVMRPKEIS